MKAPTFAANSDIQTEVIQSVQTSPKFAADPEKPKMVTSLRRALLRKIELELERQKMIQVIDVSDDETAHDLTPLKKISEEPEQLKTPASPALPLSPQSSNSRSPGRRGRGLISQVRRELREKKKEKSPPKP